MPRKDPTRTERGPKLNEAVCIGEEVKIGIHLAVQRFRLDPEQEGKIRNEGICIF